MKILLLDIETSPNTAYVWGLFKETIPLARLLDTSKVLCWSAKWLGEKEIIFCDYTDACMLDIIHRMMDEADAIVHYNGNRFDIPILHREFLLVGLSPPSPSKQIDLYRTIRSQFKFTSNKLDHIAGQLELGQKSDTNFKLWVDCMDNDPKAWKLMEKYNKQDVKLLEKLYKKILPWIKNHPNRSLFNESLVCPNCGSKHYQKRGFHYTQAGKYQRFQCNSCGNWFKQGSSVGPTIKERFSNV